MADPAASCNFSSPRAKRLLSAAFALFALLHAAPFLFVSIPPLTDLLGHMGRYSIQVNIDSSPLLRENWSFHWAPLANLGFDVLIQLLSPVMGVERASWLLAALIAPFTIWGLARISRAVHGGLSPFLVLAAPFAMAFPFQMGFVNYCLSCGLAFHLFASWVDADKQAWSVAKRLSVFLPGSALVWFCHAYGWGIFVVLAAGYELVQVARAPGGRERLSAALAHFARLAALGLPALFLLIWRNGATAVETRYFFDFGLKFSAVFALLRDQIFVFDLVCVSIYVTVIVLIVALPGVRLNKELAVPAALLFLCELLLPYKLLGSVYADLRLWPVIFQIALLSPAPASVGPIASRLIVAFGVLLAVARLGVMSAGFAQYQRDYSSHLRALDHLPAGASVVTFTPDHCNSASRSWRLPRVDHLDGLAIMRREAFVNSQWVIAGGQLLGALRASGTKFNSDPSQIVTPKPDCAGPLWPALEKRIAEIPRDRFDYLWLMGFDMAEAPTIPGAEPLYADRDSALYRLRQDPPKDYTKTHTLSR